LKNLPMRKRVFYHVEARLGNGLGRHASDSALFGLNLVEEQHSGDFEQDASGRFRLPGWLRPPIKHGHAYTLQLLPLYFVVAVLLFLVLGNSVEYLLPARTPRLWGALLGKLLLVVAVAVPAFAISRIEHRSFGDYGLPPVAAFAKLFWFGVAWGLAFLSLFLFVLKLLGMLSYGSAALHGAHVWKLGFFWAAFFVLVALFEEFTFRLHAVRHSAARRILASCVATLRDLCLHAPFESRRNLAGHDRRRGRGSVLLLYSAADWQSLVRGGNACLMGLGTKFSLRRSRQRSRGTGSSSASAPARPGLADWRQRGARRKRAAVCADRGDVGGV
jgi:hypothetical protein